MESNQTSTISLVFFVLLVGTMVAALPPVIIPAMKVYNGISVLWKNDDRRGSLRTMQPLGNLNINHVWLLYKLRNGFRLFEF